MSDYSIVKYYEEHEKHKCGYCKKPNTNLCHGMWAYSMTVADYQDLIDRGWRRCGKYCYKPTMDMTCCPMYTIKCDVLNFKPTKSQKKVIKKFNKFLAALSEGTEQTDRKMSTSSDTDVENTPAEMIMNLAAEKTENNLDIEEIVNIKKIGRKKLIDKHNRKIEAASSSKSFSTQNIEDKTSAKTVKGGVGPDPSKQPCKKAKQLRLEKKLKKLKAKGIETPILATKKTVKEKTLEDFFNDISESECSRFKIKLVRTKPPSSEWLATSKATHEVYKKYQMVIHKDKPEKLTESAFHDFLVQSPLQEEYGADSPACGYGSFHQQYWLDDKLMAVAVLDILPQCLSSVYFFYDPQYSHLGLGTYGALREMAFTRELHRTSQEIQYYYMGYYIHSCIKMRYKGNYAPSYLLCPETYKWFSIEDCRPILDQAPYARLNPDIDDLDENDCTENDLDEIPLLLDKDTIMPFKYYKICQQGKTRITDYVEAECLLDYAKLVGRRSASNLLLLRF